MSLFGGLMGLTVKPLSFAIESWRHVRVLVGGLLGATLSPVPFVMIDTSL